MFVQGRSANRDKFCDLLFIFLSHKERQENQHYNENNHEMISYNGYFYEGTTEDYAPVFVRCTCLHVDTQCVPQRNPLKRNTTVCICFEDVSTGNIWPCYPTAIWAEKECFDCSISNTCDDPDRPDAVATRKPSNSSKCLCQSVSHNCVVMPKNGEIRWWNPNNYSILRATESPTSSPELVGAFDMKVIFMTQLLNKLFKFGPMYGLRLLLNVNQSDYLPTTEAAGVRLVVHEQKVLHRLDAPYGLCSDTFRPEGYIYQEHYSPEGCYRNCFQHMVLAQCGCGDPRFPLPSDDYRPCDAKNPIERSCLSNLTGQTGGFHHLQQDCDCVQPCHENHGQLKTSKLESTVLRLNTAYIEIYYEQLNFESLKETAGYSIVNLFSDFGGNIGLWIGFSIITSKSPPSVTILRS
uniref:Uncharacterized protein n=1 Tax=Parascaris equorum TaxID=6256 RepID=A0A914S6J8_PAREQ